MEKKVFGVLKHDSVREAARDWMHHAMHIRSITVNERTGEIQYIVHSNDGDECRVIGRTFVDNSGNTIGEGEGVRVLEYAILNAGC
jgi:hypothetical protein